MLNDDMVINENDEQSVQNKKVICFIYFTIYEIMLVALTLIYHTTLMS